MPHTPILLLSFFCSSSSIHQYQNIACFNITFPALIILKNNNVAFFARAQTRRRRGWIRFRVLFWKRKRRHRYWRGCLFRQWQATCAHTQWEQRRQRAWCWRCGRSRTGHCWAYVYAHTHAHTCVIWSEQEEHARTCTCTHLTRTHLHSHAHAHAHAHTTSTLQNAYISSYTKRNQHILEFGGKKADMRACVCLCVHAQSCWRRCWRRRPKRATTAPNRITSANPNISPRRRSVCRAAVPWGCWVWLCLCMRMRMRMRMQCAYAFDLSPNISPRRGSVCRAAVPCGCVLVHSAMCVISYSRLSACFLGRVQMQKRRRQKIKRVLRLYKSQYRRLRDLLQVRQSFLFFNVYVHRNDVSTRMSIAHIVAGGCVFYMFFFHICRVYICGVFMCVCVYRNDVCIHLLMCLCSHAAAAAASAAVPRAPRGRTGASAGASPHARSHRSKDRARAARRRRAAASVSLQQERAHASTPVAYHWRRPRSCCCCCCCSREEKARRAQDVRACRLRCARAAAHWLLLRAYVHTYTHTHTHTEPMA